MAALLEGYDQASTAMDWMSWAQDAAMAVQEEKAPPPSPRSPAMFQSLLDDEQAKVRSLKKPTYEANLPANGLIPTTGFDATRREIRSRIGALQDCLTELTDSKNAIVYFEQLEASLANRQKMLYALAKALWEPVGKAPSIFGEALAFRATDVEGSYIVTVNTTINILANKRESAKLALAARLAILMPAANDIKNALIVEGIDLKGQAQRIRDLDNEVQRLQRTVVAAVTAKDDAAAYSKRCSDLLDAARLDVQETEARLDSANAAVSAMSIQIQQAAERLNQAYVCPISGVGYEKCTEPEHVKFKNLYVLSRNQLLQQLQILQSRSNELTNVANTISGELRARQEQVRNFTKEFDAAQKRLLDARGRLKNAQDSLAEKARTAENEKWKTRADIFFTENASDQQTVDAAIVQLSAGT